MAENPSEHLWLKENVDTIKRLWKIFGNGGMKVGLILIGFGIIVFILCSMTIGWGNGEFGSGMWVIFPVWIGIVGGLVVFISFLFRLWKIKTLLKNE